MKKIFSFIKTQIKKNPLLSIIILYLIIKLIDFSKNIVYFDEGIYIGIAKYFVSFGTQGYFESIRPLLLPALLMPFEYLGIPSIISSRIIGLLFSILSIIIVFHVTKKHFTKQSAIYASLLFATSFSIIIYSGYFLNDIIVYSFCLLAASLVLERKYFLSGLVIGLSFLLKFPTPLILIPTTIFIIIKEKIKFLLPLIKKGTGFLLTAGTYFTFNYFHYKGDLETRLLKPLLDASAIVQNDTWIYAKASVWRYLGQFIITEIFIFIFSALLIYLLIKNNNIKKYKEPILLFIGTALTFFVYFSFKVARYDPRYIISIIPFFAVLAGVGLKLFFKTIIKFKSYRIIARNTAIFVLSLIAILIIIFYMKPMQNDNSMIEVISGYDGEVLITNSGVPIVYTHAKTDMIASPSILYAYSQYKLNDKAKWFAIDLYGYPCKDQDDECRSDINKKIDLITQNNNIVNCGYLHGSRYIIISKDKKDNLIELERCIKNLDDWNFRLNTKNKINARATVVINEEGEIHNKNVLDNFIEFSEQNNIDTKIFIGDTDNKINQETLKYFRNTTNDIGILIKKDRDYKKFKDKISQLFDKDIHYLSTYDDEWHNDVILDKSSYKFILGSWFNKNISQYYKNIDFYVIENWEEKKLFSNKILENNFESLKESDYDIWIDIPIYALNTSQIETIKRILKN